MNSWLMGSPVNKKKNSKHDKVCYLRDETKD